MVITVETILSFGSKNFLFIQFFLVFQVAGKWGTMEQPCLILSSQDWRPLDPLRSPPHPRPEQTNTIVAGAGALPGQLGLVAGRPHGVNRVPNLCSSPGTLLKKHGPC